MRLRLKKCQKEWEQRDPDFSQLQEEVWFLPGERVEHSMRYRGKGENGDQREPAHRIRPFPYVLAVFVKIGEDLVVVPALAIETHCQVCAVISLFQ